MKSFWFLFWAYTVIWLSLAGYLMFLVLRLRRVDRRLDRMERALSSGGNVGSDQESSDS